MIRSEEYRGKREVVKVIGPRISQIYEAIKIARCSDDHPKA